MTKEKQIQIGESLNEVVFGVISQKHINGFQKAYLMAEGIDKLRQMLTNEYMAPIMELQGTKLGFRTDKDKNRDGTPGPGYTMDVVRECLIEAVFKGLQPSGNQFNIIAGNMYPTKEGLEYKANNISGLEYRIILGIPRVSPDKTSAVFENIRVKWTYDGKENNAIYEVPLKVDQYTSIDAMQGKAKRKTLAWLLSIVTGESVTDGDVTDIPHQVVKEPNANNDPITTKQREIIVEHLNRLGNRSEQWYSNRSEQWYNDIAANLDIMTQNDAIAAINQLKDLKQ